MKAIRRNFRLSIVAMLIACESYGLIGCAIADLPAAQAEAPAHVLQMPRGDEPPAPVTPAEPVVPVLTMTASISAPVGRMVRVSIQSNTPDVQWHLTGDADSLREYDPDIKTLRLCLIAYTPGKAEVQAVACLNGKMSPFGITVITFGETAPPPPVTPLPPVVPPVDPATKATAATYVYEKDATPIPSAVMAGLNRLNRERKIVATVLEQDTTNGTGDIPEQYKAPIVAARAAGIPALVVMAGDKVLKVVKAPLTEAQIWEAVP